MAIPQMSPTGQRNLVRRAVCVRVGQPSSKKKYSYRYWPIYGWPSALMQNTPDHAHSRGIRLHPYPRETTPGKENCIIVSGTWARQFFGPPMHKRNVWWYTLSCLPFPYRWEGLAIAAESWGLPKKKVAASWQRINANVAT